MKRILIVDDDARFLETLREFLTLEGFSVMTHSSIPPLSELSRVGMPDLILCDLVLPGGTGFDFLRCLRNFAATASIPFVILSARVDPPTQQEASDLGCCDYLTKPVSATHLLTTIGRQIKMNELEHSGVSRSPPRVATTVLSANAQILG